MKGIQHIENYKKNTNYKSLYLTASSWLKRRKGDNEPVLHDFRRNIIA